MKRGTALMRVIVKVANCGYLFPGNEINEGHPHLVKLQSEEVKTRFSASNI